MKRFSAIKWYIKKYWWKYFMTMVLSIGIIYCDIKKPEIIGEAVDLIGLGQINKKTLFSLLIFLIAIVIIKLLSVLLKVFALEIYFINYFIKSKFVL